MGLQVPGHRRHPGRGRAFGTRTGGSPAHRARDRAREAFHLGGPEGQAVVRDGAGEGRRALDRVEPVHGLLARPLPARGVLARVAEAGRTVHHEVRFEGEDHVGPIEVVLHGPGTADRLPQRGHRAARGLPLVPLRGGQVREELTKLRGQGRRGDRLGEDAEADPLPRALHAQRVAHRGHEIGPGADLAAVAQGLRAVGVVQAEHPGLAGGIGRPEARGMVRVPLDLGRTPEMALDEDALRVAAVEHGRGEEERLARHDLLRRPHVGDDLLFRLLGAAHESRQRERSAHHGEELATAPGIVELGGLLRELAVEELEELGCARELLQALPVRPALGAVEAATHPGEVHAHGWWLARFAHR